MSVRRRKRTGINSGSVPRPRSGCGRERRRRPSFLVSQSVIVQKHERKAGCGDLDLANPISARDGLDVFFALNTTVRFKVRPERLSTPGEVAFLDNFSCGEESTPTDQGRVSTM